MRDPHVERLHYKVSSGEGISYDTPEPISFSNYLGDFELLDGTLSVTQTDHFADEDDARKIIEPYLQSWEIEADLKSGVGSIRFTFERAEVVDRDPPPPGTPQTIQLKAGELVLVGNIVSIHVTRREYPQPPEAFIKTSEVETAYHRWLQYQERKETLQSMAYFVLTLLESIAGDQKGRQKIAAQALQIDRPVLKMIGELSSTRGDKSTARKAGPVQELSGSEKQWLESAVRRVILRLGEHASGKPMTQITMSDLPPL